MNAASPLKAGQAIKPQANKPTLLRNALSSSTDGAEANQPPALCTAQ